MNVQPLTYNSLKCVIQHLEPNIRIKFSKRCPSIRNIEKKIPMRIQNVKLDSFGISINDVTYELGSIRHFDDYTGYDIFQMHETGVKYDLDEFGVTDQVYRGTVLPGDETRTIKSHIEYQSVEVLELAVSEYKKALMNTRHQDQSRCSDNYCLHDYMRIENHQKAPTRFRHAKLFRKAFPVTSNELDGCGGAGYRIYKNCFLILFNDGLSRVEMQQNVRLLETLIELLIENHQPFSSRILLKTINKRGEERFETFVTKRRFFGSLKYLNDLFLGNRENIQIDHLECDYSDFFLMDPEDYNQYQLSKNIKIHVKNLKINESFQRTISQIIPILNESSFPLESIEIPHDDTIDFSTVPIISTARKLIYPRFFENIETYSKNQVVQIKSFQLGGFIEIVSNWRRMGRTIGTWFSFRTCDYDIGILMEKCRKNPEARYHRLEGIEGNLAHQYIFPMICSAEVLVYGSEVNNEFFANMKVVPLGIY